MTQTLPLPFPEFPADPPDLRGEALTKAEALSDAIDGPAPEGGHPALAEEAERAFPGHLLILCLAATAALLDGKPDKAQVYLKRHGLTEWREAVNVFPGGWKRRRWLAGQIDTIMDRPRPVRAARAASPAPRPTPVKPAPGSRVVARTAAPPRPASSAPPALERLAVDIPLTVHIDLGPLLSAAARPAENEGGCCSPTRWAWARPSTSPKRGKRGS